MKYKLLNYKIAKFLNCFLVFLLLSSFVSISKVNAENFTSYKSGELLVKLKSSHEIYKFKFSNQENLKELIAFYNSQPEVEYAELNYTYQATLEPQDPYYTQQLYLSHIKAHQAWNITTGDNNPIIAILDSGVDIDHPDLKNNLWINSKEIPNNSIDDDENGFTDDVYGWDFIKNTNDPSPKLDNNYSTVAINHGTVIAGIAAAQGQNNEGIAGVSWRARIMPVRALDAQGLGDTLTVARAIDYARQQGADIINLSFVGSGKSISLENAIKNAYNAGILVIAAAGNEINQGVDLEIAPAYPVCHDGPNGENWVIGVAAVDENDRLASFSNYGKKCIDLATPGVGIFSTVYQNDQNSDFQKYYKSGWTGTSVSAPQVAGAAALIKSAKPNLSLKQIKDLLLNNTEDLDKFNKNYKGQLGHGLLNVSASLTAALVESPSQISDPSKILTSPASNGGPHIRIFKKTIVQSQFFAHDENFRGGLSLASGDIDHDGEKEVVVGLGAGTYPWVKIFEQNGTLREKIVAYAETFRGGVEVALGDIDGDKNLEIITAAGKSGGPHVRIFNAHGNLISQFFAFDKNERTGLEIASADVNDDGKDEIIVTRKSGPPEIKIFNYYGKLLSSFTAYDANFTNGLHLASGNIDDDNFAEIIIGTASGLDPQVKVFNYLGKLKNEFTAYHPNFKGGVYVATGDVDENGISEIITGAGPTGGPHVRIFNQYGEVKFQFFAYDERFRGGVRVFTEK